MMASYSDSDSSDEDTIGNNFGSPYPPVIAPYPNNQGGNQYPSPGGNNGYPDSGSPGKRGRGGRGQGRGQGYGQNSPGQGRGYGGSQQGQGGGYGGNQGRGGGYGGNQQGRGGGYGGNQQGRGGGYGGNQQGPSGGYGGNQQGRGGGYGGNQQGGGGGYGGNQGGGGGYGGNSPGQNQGQGQGGGGGMRTAPVRMPTCRSDRDRVEITIPATSQCTCRRPAATDLIALRAGGPMSGIEYKIVNDEMHKTIRQHASQSFSRYNIIKIEKIKNCCLWKRYRSLQDHMAKSNVNEPTKVNERMLFHGSNVIDTIVASGFDERHSDKGGLFGAGIYFAEHSSKSNQYAFGAINKGCSAHRKTDCYNCERKMLLCRVSLGKVCKKNSPDKTAHAPPGFNSVKGVPTPGGLQYPEYCIYRGEQAYPEYMITYKIVR